MMRKASPAHNRARTPLDRHLFRRKVLAVLASGLVLGAGATASVAAWNDPVWGSSGTFAAADVDWNIMGSNDLGANWREYEEKDSAAQLAFDISASGMIPGESRTAYLGIREMSGSTGGTAVVRAPEYEAGNTLAPHIFVTIYDVGTAAPGSNPQGVEIAKGDLATLGDSAQVDVAAGGERWLAVRIELDGAVQPQKVDPVVNPYWDVQVQSS
jgi:hypothetical protein